jgi:hypothetical protein
MEKRQVGNLTYIYPCSQAPAWERISEKLLLLVMDPARTEREPNVETA